MGGKKSRSQDAEKRWVFSQHLIKYKPSVLSASDMLYTTGAFLKDLTAYLFLFFCFCFVGVLNWKCNLGCEEDRKEWAGRYGMINSCRYNTSAVHVVSGKSLSLNGLSLIVMGWNILSSHDHRWAAEELSLKRLPLAGNENKTGPFHVQFFC